MRARHRRATTPAPRSLPDVDDDERERPVVGEVEALDAQDVGAGLGAECRRGRRGRVDEAEPEDAPTGSGTGRLDRGLDGRDPTERLPDGIDGDEPARAPPARDQPFAAQHVERAPHGHAARAVLGREVDLARQRATRAHAPGSDPGPQRVGEVEVAHDLYVTCLV